ncbi:MAG: hypothetical protein RTV72_16015 [Candidatus Thorarchaeota archaeon]
MKRRNLNGFSGKINRVVTIKGERMEFFIFGSPDMTFEQALHDNWPWEERDKNKTKV